MRAYTRLTFYLAVVIVRSKKKIHWSILAQKCKREKKNKNKNKHQFLFERIKNLQRDDGGLFLAAIF